MWLTELMQTMWDAAVRQVFCDRLDRLGPDAAPRWGKLSVSGMLAHLNDSYRMTLGELPVASKWVPVRYPPLRQLVVYVLPIPKGMPTAPELIVRSGDADFDEERRALQQRIQGLAAITHAGQLVPHPAFGRLSYKEHGVLLAKHTSHHLTQFGV